MNNNAELRRIILCNSRLVRKLLLSENMIKLVKEIRAHGFIRVAKVAELKDISIQNASAKLNKLYSKGYLRREEATAKSGGIEYIYHA